LRSLAPEIYFFCGATDTIKDIIRLTQKREQTYNYCPCQPFVRM
jgi:hypothetical protein